MRAELGVDVVCHIEHRGVLGQCHQVAFGGEHDDFHCEQVKLYGVEEVDCVRFRVFQYVGDCLEPRFEFRFFVAFPDFIFPMSREAAFCYVVHLAAANLYFHPVAVCSHHREVEGTVSVGFRSAYPVACACGVELVDVGYCRVDVPAGRFLIGFFVAFEYDSYGIQVVDFFEGYVFCLHLVPDGVD